jgi:hypothetical protein
MGQDQTRNREPSDTRKQLEALYGATRRLCKNCQRDQKHVYFLQSIQSNRCDNDHSDPARRLWGNRAHGDADSIHGNSVTTHEYAISYSLTCAAHKHTRSYAHIRPADAGTGTKRRARILCRQWSASGLRA